MENGTANGNESGYVFDLSKITAREMQSFFRAAKENDMETLAGIFAKVVKAGPKGDPKSPATYLDMPFYGEFQTVLEGMGEAAKNVKSR